MKISDLIIRLVELGFSQDTELYINHYGELRKLFEEDIRKDDDGDLIIDP